MKKLFITCCLTIICMLAASAQSIYQLKVKDDAGQDVQLAQYKGKVLLIVNTATRCGFTPQYKELEALYEKYRAQGFEILDFPCNQFGEQAPGSIQEIHQFCTANFDIQFPQFDKIDVNGPDESPLFAYLKSQQGFGGFDLNDRLGKLLDEMMRKQDADYDKKPSIKWNFTKFLVTRDGQVVRRYEPTHDIAAIEADLQRELSVPEPVKNVAGRKNFGRRAVITPLPAIMIATYDASQTPDVMMAAWGGQCGPRHICFNLSAHKTTDNIRLKKAFTISFATTDDIAQSDYFGIVSANDVPDKVARAGFTATKSPNIDAPIINEYKLTLECRLVKMDEDADGGARVVGEVVNMSADESILDANGQIDLGKLQPVIFDSSNNTYRVVGKKVADAWGAGKVYEDNVH